MTVTTTNDYERGGQFLDYALARRTPLAQVVIIKVMAIDGHKDSRMYRGSIPYNLVL